MNKSKKLAKRILSILFCMTLVLSGLMVPVKRVQAETIKQLGTAMITDPMVPNKNSTAWIGNYVYFGKYNSQLIKYRVLDANTTDYSADGKTQTMLLDCDRILYTTKFDEDGKSNATGKYANDWSVSDIKTSLNGADFLEKEGVLTDAEKDAIAESTVGSHALTTDGTTGRAVTEQNLEVYENYVALVGDKVFILDVEDVCNEAYGYTRGIYWDILGDYYYGRQAREKKDLSNQAGDYWLRSAQDKINAGSVSDTSTIGQWSVNYTDLGVSPAFNLDQASVLLSSVVEETNSNGGTSYKLTLIDSDMTIVPKDVTKNGSTITIPYTINGSNKANATKVSVLVLDKKYTAGNTNQAKILDYQKVTTYVAANSATYTIPAFLSGKQAGSDYYIYVLAEDVNGDRETDYASEPVELHLWETPTVKGMNFGTKGIVDPAVPNSTSDAWKGCYVYLGNYDNSSVKYRVLDANTTEYSADGVTQTMLLDCDSVLYSASFDGESPYSPVWKDSPIYHSLNGNGFLDNEGVFTETEKNAIAASTVGSHALTIDSETGVNVTTGIMNSFINYVALNGEKIFLLDVEDVSNGAYGYSMTSGDCTNRKKAGDTAAVWWLRSVYNGGWSDVGDISSSGSIYYGGVDNDSIGVSPALNLKLTSVFFSSASTVSKSAAITSKSTKIGITTNTDWKLTLKDSGKAVTLTEDRNITQASDGTITVPYTYMDNAVADTEKVNQISVMITDVAYENDSAEILYYGALSDIRNTAGETSTVTESTTGTGTFTLPSDLTGTMGEDYHIYLLPEHVSEGTGTDYAGEPLEITTILNVVGTIEVPEIERPTPEQPFVRTISISSTGTLETATVLWKKDDEEVAGNVDWKTTYKAYVTLTPVDGYTFMDATGQVARITVNGKQGDSEAVTWHEDGTITVYFLEYTTATRKIESVVAPQIPEQFANYYIADDVLSSKELGATAKITLQGTLQPNPIDMKVKWQVVDEAGNIAIYDETPSAYNTFKWTITPSEYAQYDVNDIVMEGTVTIQNKRYVPGIITRPTVADRTYHPKKSLVDSDIMGGEVKDQNGNIIVGNWSWKEQNVVPSVDKKAYEVVFTPTDIEHYEPITEMVIVNVAKATPVIVLNPTASDITCGSTLQASVLSGGKVQLSETDTIEVVGSFNWKDSTVKPLAKDSGITEYAVVFTPIDVVNYNTVETKVTVILTTPVVGVTAVSDDGTATYKITKSDSEESSVTYVAPTNKKATTVTIPATVKINGLTYKVTIIEKNAFKKNKYIKSVTIGQNIKTIGTNAFYNCIKLRTVKFGKNVFTIGDKAFYKCTALTKISIPSKVKTIGKSAFYGCKKVKSITIGKSVSKIGAKAFYGCSKVKTLTIKSTKLTTKKIGKKAFSKMQKSMKVKIPKKKYNAYKSMLIKRGVNKKAKFKKN